MLLEPFGIFRVYVDGNCVYEKIFGVDRVSVGKCNTRKFECKYLLLRAWVK